MTYDQGPRYFLFEIQNKIWFIDLNLVKAVCKTSTIEKDFIRLHFFEQKNTNLALVLQNENFHLAIGVDRVLPVGTKIEDQMQKFNFEDLLTEQDRKQNQSIQSNTIHQKALKPFILIESCNKKIALSLDEVIEIVSPTELQEKNLVSERSIGFLNRRGLVIPVIHISSTIPKDILSQVGGLLVIEKNSLRIAFTVDRIVRLTMLSSQQVEAGQFKETSDVVWQICNSDRFVSNDEIERTVKGYQNIYRSENPFELHSQNKTQEGTYLEYQLYEKMHIPLLDVIAVDVLNVDTPTSENKKTHAPSYLGEQLWNGESVPVFDGRGLYDFEKNTQNLSKQRVIIIKKHSFRFGICVDEIKSIVRVNYSLKKEYPRILLRCFSTDFQNDITDFYQTMDSLHKNILNISVISFETAYKLCKPYAEKLQTLNKVS